MPYKVIRICKNCYLKTYKFHSYFFITFDLEKIASKINNSEEKVNLEQCFDYQKKEEVLKDFMCNNCFKINPHSQNKFYYSGPVLLVVNIKNDFKNKISLYLNETLDIKEHIEFQDLPTKFALKGILKQKEGKYFSNINSGMITTSQAIPSLVTAGSMFLSMLFWPLISRVIEKKFALSALMLYHIVMICIEYI